MAYKRKRQLTAVGHTLFSLFRLIVLLAIGFVVLYPFLYMIVTSLRTRESFMNSARVWIPEAIDPVKNYRIAARVLLVWEFPVIYAVLRDGQCID